MIGQTTTPFTQQSGWNQLGAGQAGGMGQFGQLGGIPSMYGQGQFGQAGQHADVGAVAGSVVSSVLPHILAGLRGQQAGGYGAPQFGQLGALPAMYGQFGQQGQQTDIGSIAGAVVASVLPHLVGAQRGQQAGGYGMQQPFGQLGAMPAMYGQFGQQWGQQTDIGAIAGAVVASVLPHILGAQRGQQSGGYGQFGGGVPGLLQQGQFGQGQFGQGQHGQQLDLGSILGPVVASVLGTLQGQSPQHGGLWGRA